ncbi:MAG: MerR family transcriptional regulator [Gammaproteobacteria bacterium]|nr:MerR family transcriptional regulator [Gammaproteobacteria bacterium]
MASAVYSSKQAASISGLSLRQLHYWRKTGLITPSHFTRGGHSRYTFTDLLALKTSKRLIEAGVSVQRIRECIHSLLNLLPQLQQPLTECSLVVTGDVVLVFSNGTAFEALTGQEWVFPVAELARDIERFSPTTIHPPVQGELFSAQDSIQEEKSLHLAHSGGAGL